MAVIRPFKCVRPREGLAEDIAALPYDVYNREEAAKAVDGKPLSFLNIDRPETQFDVSADMYSPEVYKKAKELLDKMIEAGNYIKDNDNTYYIYELTMDGRHQTGIVACASIDDYLNNVIKKHENTREEKEIDRIKHVDTCSAQTGPIFLAYRADEVINAEIKKAVGNKPVYDFVSDDGIRHTVWKITDERSVSNIKKAFSSIDDIYIADGHHRAASAVKVGLKRRTENPGYTGDEEFNYFLSVLFSDDQLMIMDYNRVVKDLNGYSTQEFIDRLSDKFDVEASDKQVKPSKKGDIGMYVDGSWYCLHAHSNIMPDDPVDGLDVSILQNNVLTPLLGITDPRTDNRIDFIGGIRGLGELERRVSLDMKAAFAMYPTSINELFCVADAKRLMPPKSTWFEPKLRSGLFIHMI